MASASTAMSIHRVHGRRVQRAVPDIGDLAGEQRPCLAPVGAAVVQHLTGAFRLGRARLVAPGGVIRHAIARLGDHQQGPRIVEVAEPDHRHLGQPEHGGGRHPAVPRDQLAVVGHHAGDDPAELGHAGGDLRHLVVAMHLGIAGIGAQPGSRPSFSLARREVEVYGVGLGMWGRKMKSAREGAPPGAILRRSRGRPTGAGLSTGKVKRFQRVPTNLGLP